MNAIVDFLHKYWLSLVLLIGIIVAAVYVYRHRDLLMIKKQ